MSSNWRRSALLRSEPRLSFDRGGNRADQSRQRYIGPMAQDFHALFALGTDTTIATLDVEGVTLVGIKALERRTADLQNENKALRSDNAALRHQLEKLMQRVEQLETRRSAAN